jgi:uncharacterized damage-inducible protein DinB
MEPATIQTMFRFNTWANENVREGLLSADEQVLRAPIEGFWFGSIFYILTHILGGESIWLARLRNSETDARPPSVDEFASAEGLADAWRRKDEEWEDWAATVTPAELDEPRTWRRRDGAEYTISPGLVAMQIAFHSTEHRGHATVAMTQLGIKHGPQDFLDQFRATPPVAG